LSVDKLIIKGLPARDNVLGNVSSKNTLTSSFFPFPLPFSFSPYTRDSCLVQTQGPNKNFPAQITRIYYSTVNDNNNKSQGLNPWWVTGYTDAEGCFMVNTAKAKTAK